MLETSWETLDAEVKAAVSLDEVIDAHSKYLNSIMDKALMSGRAEAIVTPLNDVLEDSLRFCRTQDQVHTRHIRSGPSSHC